MADYCLRMRKPLSPELKVHVDASGANPKLKNWNGETAIEVAEGEIKKLLTKKK